MGHLPVTSSLTFHLSELGVQLSLLFVKFNQLRCSTAVSLSQLQTGCQNLGTPSDWLASYTCVRHKHAARTPPNPLLQVQVVRLPSEGPESWTPVETELDSLTPHERELHWSDSQHTISTSPAQSPDWLQEPEMLR